MPTPNDTQALVFLVDNGESYDEHRESQITSDLGDGVHLTVEDVQAIATVQKCKVFGWLQADAMHWIDLTGPDNASEWINLRDFVKYDWDDDLDGYRCWLEPDVADLPADLIAKVLKGCNPESMAELLETLRQHLLDLQAGEPTTVEVHTPYCDAIRFPRPKGEPRLKCDCGYGRED